MNYLVRNDNEQNREVRKHYYKEVFLPSPFWKKFSEDMKKEHNYTCQVCNGTYQKGKEDLETHHNSYPNNFYSIKKEDCIVMCSHCHKQVTFYPFENELELIPDGTILDFEIKNISEYQNYYYIELSVVYKGVNKTIKHFPKKEQTWFKNLLSSVGYQSRTIRYEELIGKKGTIEINHYRNGNDEVVNSVKRYIQK